MGIDTWEIRNEILDAMADVLGSDSRVPPDQQKKFQAYAKIKKAEREAERLIEDAKSDAEEEAKTEKVDDTDEDGE